MPLDPLTVNLRGMNPDWARLYPLNQHASDSEEDEGDLPNGDLWPPRVAAAAYLAVSCPGLLLNAVLHCMFMQHDVMM